MQGTSEAKGRTGICAAQQNVPVRQVDSQWNEVPTTFLTRGADVGGQGVVESTSPRRERKAGLWPNRRWQTRTFHGILCATPPSHPIPKRFPEIPANPLRNSLPWCGSCPHHFSPHGLLQRPLNWHRFLQSLLSSIHPGCCYSFLSKENLTMLFIVILLNGSGETLNS